MRLYPAIDLKDGNCVRLLQGDYNEVTVFGNNPGEMAKKWESLGGDLLHIVDLDGAKEGKGINDEAVKDIINNLTIPAELGGGIRSIEDIENKLSLGVSRVILGSAAVKNPELVKEAVAKFGADKIVVGVDAKSGMVAVEGWLEVSDKEALSFCKELEKIVKEAVAKFGADKIVVGVDAKSGMVAVEGWLEVSDKEALSFCKELEKIGVTTVIYTDIAKDGMMQGPNIEETKKLVDNTNLNIIASGGVSTLDDLKKLAEIGVEGAIVGKAIYTGAIQLDEAAALFKN